MKFQTKCIISVLTVFMISGCSVQKSVTESSSASKINKSIDDAIAAIQKTQIELYQYGAISQKKMVSPEVSILTELRLMQTGMVMLPSCLRKWQTNGIILSGL